MHLESPLQCLSFKWYVWMLLNMYSGKGNLKWSPSGEAVLEKFIMSLRIICVRLKDFNSLRSHKAQKLVSWQSLYAVFGVVFVLFCIFGGFFCQGVKQQVVFLHPIFFFGVICLSPLVLHCFLSNNSLCTALSSTA